MIRWLKDKIPRPVTIRPGATWDRMADMIELFLEDTRNAFTALPRYLQKTFVFDPDTAPLAISVGFTPVHVEAVWVKIRGTNTPVAVGNVFWSPDLTAKGILLSNVVGLSSGTIYEVTLLITGEN